MSFTLLSIASGSKGNATLLAYDDALFLIDMGVSKKALKEGLSSLGKETADIDAVFFTHDHNDHIKGVRYLPPGLDFYAGPSAVPYPHQSLCPGDEVSIKGVTVTAVATSHDAPDSLAYVFQLGEDKLSYVTDTGYIPSKTLPFLRDSTFFFIESNHDLDMLKYSGRPLSLIRRIRGRKGHLSNLQCTQYLSSLVGAATRKIVLAHLSEECNDEALAIAVVSEGLKEKGLDLTGIEISAARQWEMRSWE